MVTGPANHRNNFGGTSAATPLCAGVAALVLSAKPSLTFVEARQILRDTADKIDTGNTDSTGQWLDVDGNPSLDSGLAPVWSSWYGYGRVNAESAVKAALAFAGSADFVLRDSLADTGAMPSTGSFANSPDIWCRRTEPSLDPGALPATYAIAGPHEDPLRGQKNWVYVRVYNRGPSSSLDAWVRVSVTHFPGLEFTYPTSFRPSKRPSDLLPSPVEPGTYFIGEAKVTGVPPNGDRVVVIEWPQALIPPDSVATSAGPAQWHPCLLAEVTPHDASDATGPHVWDDNNLAQKNISIVDAGVGGAFVVATVVGNEENDADVLLLEVVRDRLPQEVELYVDFLDPRLLQRLIESVPTPPEPLPRSVDGGIFGGVRRTWALSSALTAAKPTARCAPVASA